MAKRSYRNILKALAWRGFFNFLPDKPYIKLTYKWTFGKRLNLKHPVLFSEKLQWLKLYNRRPEYTAMVDKYRAKQYAAGLVGEEYIIPTLGVWDRFKDIDFDRLPDQFVLKCTHDCGGQVICRDKATLDMAAAKAKLTAALRHNYYKRWREWPYKNVHRRILAEAYMEDKNGELDDYKFTCFNGKADHVMVCIGRKTGQPQFYFFNENWELLRLNQRGLAAPADFTLPKPENLEKMFEIAGKLSEGLPYARIDLYNLNGKIYFGEITFFPQSGLDNNLLPSTDIMLGERLTLPEVTRN